MDSKRKGFRKAEDYDGRCIYSDFKMFGDNEERNRKRGPHFKRIEL